MDSTFKTLLTISTALSLALCTIVSPRTITAASSLSPSPVSVPHRQPEGTCEHLSQPTSVPYSGPSCSSVSFRVNTKVHAMACRVPPICPRLVSTLLLPLLQTLAPLMSLRLTRHAPPSGPFTDSSLHLQSSSHRHPQDSLRA